MDINSLDKSWTLFLDRDGVINKKINRDFVLDWEEFEYCKLAIPAISILSSYFSRIIIVTNQRCVDEGLLLEQDLMKIHDNILSDIEEYTNVTDDIYFYFCPHTKMSDCGCRKPKTGMALQAKKDFPDINFEKSIMVGDSITDLQFGKRLNMKTVFINDEENPVLRDSLADSVFQSLFNFANYIDSELAGVSKI